MSEEIICEGCSSNNIKILNHKPAVFLCENCGDVWKCPEMNIIEEVNENGKKT